MKLHIATTRKTLQLPAIIAIFNMALSAQTDFDYQLTRQQVNKVILIGDWKPDEISMWKQLIDSEGIYQHGFVIFDRVGLTDALGRAFGIRSSEDFMAFERWLIQRYATGGARWIVLDIENKLITSGIQTPGAEEFERILDQRGLQTPLQKVRAFLRENPDHIDAKTDLLKEVRRRALRQTPPDVSEDLDAEKDLRTWGVLAAETNNVFGGSWLGVDLDFFRPDQEPPERFSKLMKAAFRRHIANVESALREQPTNRTLWNIWAWMARSLADYKWNTFVDSLESIKFGAYSPVVDGLLCPSAEVCVWLVEDSRTKGDWDSVIKFAEVAGRFIGYFQQSKNTWMPGDGQRGQYAMAGFKDYPIKPLYMPHLEALLRLGRIDDANNLFDQMMRLNGEREDAILAAQVARSVGLEDVAKVWEQGQIIGNAPYLALKRISDERPYFCVLGTSDFYGKFNELYRSLSTTKLDLTRRGILNDGHLETLGWKRDGGDRWGLIGTDGRLLYQDTSVPEINELLAILRRFNIEVESDADFFRNYTSRHRDQPGIILYFAISLIRNNRQDEALDEAAGLLSKILNEYPHVLIDMPGMIGNYDYLKNNASLKALSGRYLTNLETLLEKKPSSENLWYQWFLWRTIEDTNRSALPVISRVKFSPLSLPGTVPPGFVLNRYYEECKANGDWPKVIELLKNVWDREYFNILKVQNENPGQKLSNTQLGDKVGIPLMEAYLNDQKPSLADDIFNAWLGCGGTFTDFTKVIELAKTKAQERLAREWETRIKK